MFFMGLLYAAPLLATLAFIIVILGHVLGRLEGWSGADAMYHAFITATTVGYGDFCPRQKRSKVLAVAIAFVGIVFTGIIVAIALHSASHAFEKTHDVAKIVEKVAE